MSAKIHNIFFDNFSYNSIYSAYNLTKRCKCYRPEVILFNMKLEYNLNKILLDLKNETYTFGKYKEFYVYEPKQRRILAAPFRDRIVHTFYVKNYIEPYFVPTFISTSYACLSGKGMHRCALDLQKTLYTCSYLSEYSKSYILKMDVTKFFNNIDRNILFSIISKKIDDKYFLNLTHQILNSSSSFDDIKGVGLPIGNYTSQMFANIYLNELDKFCKHELKCRYIFRYMDDVVLILKSKQEAKDDLKKIEEFLWDNLKLTLNSKTNIFKLSQGVNFCGYKISKYGLKIRDKGKKRLKLKLKIINKKLKTGSITSSDAKHMLAGHIGYIKISNMLGLLNK